MHLYSAGYCVFDITTQHFERLPPNGQRNFRLRAVDKFLCLGNVFFFAHYIHYVIDVGIFRCELLKFAFGAGNILFVFFLNAADKVLILDRLVKIRFSVYTDDRTLCNQTIDDLINQRTRNAGQFGDFVAV